MSSKLNDAEKTLAILLLARGYEKLYQKTNAVLLKDLEPWFDRPSRLQKAVARMVVRGIVDRSLGTQQLFIDVNKLLATLQFKRVTVPDLFLSANSIAPAQSSSSKSDAPVPAAVAVKPSPKPSKISHAAHVHAPHASSFMPQVSQKIPASHESCNKNSSKKIHDHVMKHEVNELEKRTTEEMLSDIRKLIPNIKKEFLEQWQKRIELENAEAVNGVIRQAQLHQNDGKIKNLAGWMNQCYLVAIGVRERKTK